MTGHSGPPAPQRGAPGLRRALLEVELDGRCEWVTVTVSADGSGARAVTSDGLHQGPLVDAALALLGYDSAAPSAVPSVPPRSPTIAPERPALRRESLPPPDEHARADEPLAGAAAAFEDLVTAVVRVGVDEAAEAPSVLAARERLIAASPAPLPLGLARYLGRLRAALLTRDVVVVARLLDEASRFTAAARQRTPSGTERERLRVMMGPFVDSRAEMVSDRVLVELAREWVAGAERSGIERRLLIDTESGELLVECRTRQGVASLGPCPRTVRVGLAEVDPGPSPRRIRVLQYELSNGLDALGHARILEHAERDLSAVRARCQREIKAYPGLSEPFVVFAPAHTSRDGALAFTDARGALLTLARGHDEGRSAALERALRTQEPEWVVGALGEREDGLVLDPCGVGFREGSTARYLRLG